MGCSRRRGHLTTTRVSWHDTARVYERATPPGGIVQYGLPAWMTHSVPFRAQLLGTCMSACRRRKAETTLGRLLAPATSSIAARPAPNERNGMSFSRNTAWHGKPMSWDCASTAEESHKFDKGGIKVGFSGFVPRAAWHYGSSHVGSLPYRDRQNWDFGKKPTAGNRRSRSASWLNPSSAREIGRQAWNIEWVGTGQASLRKFECAPAVTCPASVT